MSWVTSILLFKQLREKAMATYDYLRKQALKDIWRVPSIDRQYIIKPQRITRDYGRKKNITVMWETLSLPDRDSRWHVYDSGPIAPIVLNLFRRCQGWTPVSEATNRRGVFTNVYNDSGVELPRFDSYYRYTETGSLLFAFKINKKLLVNLDNEDVFIRVYSGADNSIGQEVPVDIHVKTNGLYVAAGTDLTDFIDEIEDLDPEGKVFVYHNGIYCNSNFNGITVSNGDYIEYIWDKSFYKTFEFPVKDLYHYNSDMDSDQKYLLHYLGVSDDLDFYDDIEVYVYQKNGALLHRGVYFHKNSKAAVRQLTHRDYGLRTRNIPPIARVLEKLKNPVLDAPLDSLYIRLDIRRSGLTTNKLVYEHGRLFELYKLSDTDIVRAMQGIDSSVPFWAAPELEKSFYTYAMRCSYNELTKEVAEKAFGYNASAKIIGDTPVKIPVNTVIDVPLPIRMQHGCTMYEYNEDGHLIDWHQHLAGSTYRPKSLDTVYIEGIVGLGSDRLDQVHNVKQLNLNEVFTYRVYNGTIIGNFVQPVFEDVTGSDKYEVVDGNFNWLSNRAVDYPVVMSDRSFFAKDYKIRPNFGNLTITLMTQQNRPAGDGYYKMIVPMAQMDVFLNKRPLIKNLDYFVDFPNVIIVNHEYLEDPLTKDQDVHIRFCGFTNKDFEILDDGDVGFIEHGFFSNNNRYDVRDDKVQRIVVGGRLVHKSEIEFSEDNTGISIVNSANGLPYMIKDILVPVKPYTVVDMYELKKQSVERDKIVSDYLTLKLPQPDRGDLMAIPNRYRVFSPFMNKLITDVRSGVISLPLRVSGFSKQETINICKSYEYLLNFDPLRSPNLQDSRFVVIIPHGYPQVLSVSSNAYRFLQKVVDTYANGLTELSPFIKIS